MSLIHHAICQQTCMESILNLFNEKQLSSKLEARKSLQTIWACMFVLWNKFWLSVWSKDIFLRQHRDDNCPQGQTKSMRAHTWLKHGQLWSWLRSVCAFLKCSSVATVRVRCMCVFRFISLYELVDPSQETHHQLSRRPLQNQSCFAYYIMYQHQKVYICECALISQLQNQVSQHEKWCTAHKNCYRICKVNKDSLRFEWSMLPWKWHHI